jgi:hypothetical protein
VIEPVSNSSKREVGREITKQCNGSENNQEAKTGLRKVQSLVKPLKSIKNKPGSCQQWNNEKSSAEEISQYLS